MAGTAYVQMAALSWLGLIAALPAGLLSCALLMINNLRDIGSDADVGKRTLAVRFGDPRSRTVYLMCLLVPFVVALAITPARPLAALTLAALPLASGPDPGGPVRRGGPRADPRPRADRPPAARVRRRPHHRSGYPLLTARRASPSGQGRTAAARAHRNVRVGSG